ncbi:hypothetical protein VTK26DRAFT_6291 [Humicola hyalothermophila]
MTLATSSAPAFFKRDERLPRELPAGPPFPSMILVFTTSAGVVMNAARAPDPAAAAAATTAASVMGHLVPHSALPSFCGPRHAMSSSITPESVASEGSDQWFRRHFQMCLRKSSYTGKWIAVNGKFLATKIAYPRDNVRRAPPPLRRSIWNASTDEDWPNRADPERWSTWAFCLMTSAGVSTVQDAISAPAEARAWVAGSGTAAGRLLSSSDLADS